MQAFHRDTMDSGQQRNETTATQSSEAKTRSGVYHEETTRSREVEHGIHNDSAVEQHEEIYKDDIQFSIK
jgi:hypothetical protein